MSLQSVRLLNHTLRMRLSHLLNYYEAIPSPRADARCPPSDSTARPTLQEPKTCQRLRLSPLTPAAQSSHKDTQAVTKPRLAPIRQLSRGQQCTMNRADLH